MSSYAYDLRTGDREGIIARYHPDGAYLLGNGHKAFETRDSIAAHYRTQWSRPAAFRWEDLSYEPVGADAVVVAGRFVWEAHGREPARFSYTGLLVRSGGGLRIRLEDESGAPPRPVQRDSTTR